MGHRRNGYGPKPTTSLIFRERFGKIHQPSAIQAPVEAIRRLIAKEESMPSISALYSIEEVSQHSSNDDCWIIIDGKVYDVTTYLDEHPGGDDVIVAATGRDATDDFEDAGHSKDARELMESFYIGELDASSSASPELETKPETKQLDGYADRVQALTKKYWAGPVAILGVSAVLGWLYLSKK